MRLWSLHPKYLDAKGLVALWREGLLAQKVLQGLTKGYVNHPQLERFRNQTDPVGMISFYLMGVCTEAEKRGYRFNRAKINKITCDEGAPRMTVSSGQIVYEFQLLKEKLRLRNPEKHRVLASLETPDVHPAFEIIQGGIESWEQIQ